MFVYPLHTLSLWKTTRERADAKFVNRNGFVCVACRCIVKEA